MALSPGPAIDEGPFWRGEVLEAMFWLGRAGRPIAVEERTLTGLLEGPKAAIEGALVDLEASGAVASTADRYTLTEKGAREARRCFFESAHDVGRFVEGFTRCGPGCWCKHADASRSPASSEDVGVGGPG